MNHKIKVDALLAIQTATTLFRTSASSHIEIQVSNNSGHAITIRQIGVKIGGLFGKTIKSPVLNLRILHGKFVNIPIQLFSEDFHAFGRDKRTRVFAMTDNNKKYYSENYTLGQMNIK